jgi:hypothetical protein
LFAFVSLFAFVGHCLTRRVCWRRRSCWKRNDEMMFPISNSVFWINFWFFPKKMFLQNQHWFTASLNRLGSDCGSWSVRSNVWTDTLFWGGFLCNKHLYFPNVFEK